MPGIRGDLSVMPLTDLIIWIANRKLTCILTLHRGTIKKDFAIEEGTVVRASSTAKHEALGQFLVNFNLMTEDQLQRAFDVQQQTKVLLGRILVMIGIVGEDQVRQTLELHIRETLLDALRWTDGVFVLERRQKPRDKPEIAVSVPLLEVHREATRRQPLWEQYTGVFPSQQMMLMVNDLRVPKTLDPTSLDGRIISYAQAGLTIESLLLELHAPEFQVLSRLHELYRRGVLEAREASVRRSDPLPSSPLAGTVEDTDDELELGERAQRALDEEDYATALKHAEAGAKSWPANTDLADIGRQAAAKLQEQMESELPPTSAVPVLLKRMDEMSAVRKISARERYIIARVDGKRSIRSIMQVSPMRDIEALAIFQKLINDGFIRV